MLCFPAILGSSTIIRFLPTNSVLLVRLLVRAVSSFAKMQRAQDEWQYAQCLFVKPFGEQKWKSCRLIFAQCSADEVDGLMGWGQVCLDKFELSQALALRSPSLYVPLLLVLLAPLQARSIVLSWALFLVGWVVPALGGPLGWLGSAYHSRLHRCNYC
jgi:hypothetical protein